MSHFARAMAGAGLYGQIRAAAPVPRSTFCTTAALCKRCHSPRPRPEQCIKGLRRQDQDHGRLRLPLRSRLDCHGLPIEIKVDEQLGRKKLEMDPIAVRRACPSTRRSTSRPPEQPVSADRRLGRWDNPYKTMSFEYRPHPETSTTSFEKDFVYKASNRLLVHPRPHRPRRGRGRV